MTATTLDGITKLCTRCKAEHGYWHDGKCLICRQAHESSRKPHPKMPDFSDRNVAEQN